MIYGYVRHSLNNEEFINLQIEQLRDVDKIVVEDNGAIQLHNLIRNLKKDDSIVVTSIDRLKNISQEDVSFLKENKILISTQDGLRSDYEPDEKDNLFFKKQSLYDLLEESVNKRELNKKKEVPQRKISL